MFFPKFINSKSTKILSSIKEIKNTNKENLDKKQIFGLEAIKKTASCEKTDEYYDLNLQFIEKGKVARTSINEIEKSLGCNLAEAIKRSYFLIDLEHKKSKNEGLEPAKSMK